MARFYRVDLQRNLPISTEITGYAASAFSFMYTVTGDMAYRDAAVAAARFLARSAWNAQTLAMPFELDPPALSYFFDCGIIARGLLAVWRVTQDAELLSVATAVGASMHSDFARADGGFQPVVTLPAKEPLDIDANRWSRAPGCYQLKSAMAWNSLGQAAEYDAALESTLARHATFLPGHSDPGKIMDRLHAYLYFLEGLLPRAHMPDCAVAIRDGIARVAHYVAEISPQFVRTDVLAQLLRMRLCAQTFGVATLDEAAAQTEAALIAGFQAESADGRIDGGFYFGRREGVMIPHMSPVSTAFALQALRMWEHGAGVDPAELV